MSGSNPGTTGGTDATSAAPVDSRISREEGLRYWEGISADVSGMLGGFPRVSKVDLQGSCAFLAKLGIGSAAAAGRTRAGGSGGGLREVDRALEGGAG